MRALGLAALLAAAAACGTAGRFDGRTFVNDHTSYRVGALPGFARTQAPDTDLAFRHPSEGVVGVHSTCEGYEDVPPRALANHLLFGTTDREYLVDEAAEVDGRQARHLLVRARLDGVAVELEAFVLVKNGCIYDLTHARMPGAPPAARARFLSFVSSFAVIKP